jgi:hypothetical protein
LNEAVALRTDVEAVGVVFWWAGVHAFVVKEVRDGGIGIA